MFKNYSDEEIIGWYKENVNFNFKLEPEDYGRGWFIKEKIMNRERLLLIHHNLVDSYRILQNGMPKLSRNKFPSIIQRPRIEIGGKKYVDCPIKDFFFSFIEENTSLYCDLSTNEMFLNFIIRIGRNTRFRENYNKTELTFKSLFDSCGLCWN